MHAYKSVFSTKVNVFLLLQFHDSIPSCSATFGSTVNYHGPYVADIIIFLESWVGKILPDDFSILLQPSQYINTVFVPKDGQIPVDIDFLSSQGIVNVVCVFFGYKSSYIKKCLEIYSLFAEVLVLMYSNFSAHILF